MDGEVDFNDILHKAELLTAEIDTSSELPRVQRNLRQVLEAGQLLLERAARDGPRLDSETKAAVFLGTKGVDVTKLTEKLDPISAFQSSIETYEPPVDVDLDEFLKNERMNAMCSIVEKSAQDMFEELKEKNWKTMDSEWEAEKQEILSSLSGSLKSLQFEQVMFDYKPDPLSVLSQSEITYAHEINQYNNAIINNLPKPNLLERLHIAAKNSNDRNEQELWATLVAMVSNLPVDSPDRIPERRSSEQFVSMMIARAKTYLEQTFFTRLQDCVWNHPGGTELGGVPGAMNLIRNFISISGLSGVSGLEVGAGDVGPVWLTLFLLLRSGRLSEAVTYMRDSICNNEFARILEEYEKSGATKLPADMENKLRLEYRRTLQNSARDRYKKAVYCILGGCDVEDDHVEVASRLDDYLWLKLAVVRHNKDQTYTADFITYSGLQQKVYETYGEVYFDAFKQPYVYTQALILTGQFEAAIEFMSRVNGMLTHALHVAIALNENSLLLVSDPKEQMLSRKDTDPPGLRTLNFCRLMITFARSLQGSNARDALNYLYLLRNIRDKEGNDLFSICVSDLVMDSRDFDLLGVLNPDGCKNPGLLEQMGIDVQPIILRCASEAEVSGLLEDAILLYDLASNHEQVLRILCRVLAQNMSKPPIPDSPRQRIQRLAIAYAERFQGHAPRCKDMSLPSTFYVLVDFMTFFDTVHSRQTDIALSIISRLKVIPLDKSEVEKCKTDFHTFSDEIRTNIPNVIVAAMETIFTKYKSVKSGRRGTLGMDSSKVDVYLNDLKAKAHSLVTYCGMIPYFMTGDVYTKVMQIEVQMN